MSSQKKVKRHWRYSNQQPEQNKRSYYSIGEVAKMFDIDEAQLRYWEHHTPLKPERSSKSGARLYSAKDLELVGRIRYLLLEKGYSLQAITKDQLEGKEIETDLMIKEKLLDVKERVRALRAIVDRQLADK
ncbi:MAG: MerR family transcriptional regulator [Porphyromonas sp.]|nr:MerR family transcriptional regulator [Porphyromonas sp.]